jgi:hypothetical protein
VSPGLGGGLTVPEVSIFILSAIFMVPPKDVTFTYRRQRTCKAKPSHRGRSRALALVSEIPVIKRRSPNLVAGERPYPRDR